ncbi:MAG: hypothetical protein KIS86_02060 [Devosia sp.]|nr:hypothetical protein [Devosia sp.]
MNFTYSFLSGDLRRFIARGLQVKMVAPSRNHLYRRRSQVMIDAGPRNHLYLLGQQVKIRSCPRNQYEKPARIIDPAGFFMACSWSVPAGNGWMVAASRLQGGHVRRLVVAATLVAGFMLPAIVGYAVMVWRLILMAHGRPDEALSPGSPRRSGGKPVSARAPA